MIAERPDGRAELFGVRDRQGRWRLYRYQLVDEGLVADASNAACRRTWSR